ncbi:MAG: SGNH/GDSL hydrolase family protein [Nitrospinae bacterium]|nr:SGNH/GDSL hydrolase family protein [Nitrospinota bacterium]
MIHSTKIDKQIIHKKNMLGFRGENPPKNFEEKLTLITVGGSTTECFYLSDGKTWTDVLGKKLNARFSNGTWINNAGLDGHSTFGHLVLMEDYIVRLKPKIALFLVGINDLGREDLRSYDQVQWKKGISFYSCTDFLISMSHYSEVFSLALNMHRYIISNKMR